MDQRLPLAIATPVIRTAACELVRLALVALDDMRTLDDGLYERFVSSRTAGQGLTQEGLRRLWIDTFRSLEQLLVYRRMITAKPAATPAGSAAGSPAASPEASIDELDFGESAGMTEMSFDLEASDIGDLVAGLDDPTPRENDGERWAAVLDKIGMIQYALERQYGDATSRMTNALVGGQIGLVLGLLDDTTSNANEAIHALVAAVYTAFIPDVDQSTVVPEYLTTLTRALKVRRGIAQLAATLGPHNDVLQHDDASRHAEALAAIRGAVSEFVSSDVWRVMRAADRWEIAQFDQQLREQAVGAMRPTAEGLVKYLESLGAINQREVLVQHDARVLDELREATTNAQALISLSPVTTHQLLVKACETALALRGRRPVLDRLLDRLEHAEASSPAQNASLIERLSEIVAAAG